MNEKLIFWLFALIFILSCLCVCFFLKYESAEAQVIVSPLYSTTTTDNAITVSENAPVTAEDAALSEATININTATKEELMTLNGIGDVISDRIIAYRTENGNFLSIEEIMEVSGIGEATFNKIKDRICV